MCKFISSGMDFISCLYPSWLWMPLCSLSCPRFLFLFLKYFTNFLFLCAIYNLTPEHILLHTLQWIFFPLRRLRNLIGMAWYLLRLLFGDGLLKGVSFQRVHFQKYFALLCATGVNCILNWSYRGDYFHRPPFTLYIFRWHQCFERLSCLWCCNDNQ